ncbi:MAG: 4-alpha-glucanotransferase [Bacteroidales bacterium]|nr:4-alpha-glucanotransferase [Bacteroidales bacterium]
MKATFKIEYHTRWGESLCLVAQDRKFPMEWGDGDVWSVTLPRCTAADLADHSYVVMENGLIVRTEWKHHKTVLASGMRRADIVDNWIDCPIPGCPFTREHQNPRFDIPGFRGAGTAVPVFSLRSRTGFGIGEFNDLRPLVDWAAATGQCMLQLLPVNDTTRKGEWTDSYPYSPVSSFALHPLYMNLQALGVQQTASFLEEQEALNALDEIDYPRVFKAKTKYLRQAFLERGGKDMKTAAFRKFRKENAGWLEEYAGFCSKRDSLEPDYYCWMQYHLDLQFGTVADYARNRGVSLKGDLPIGVSGDSAEAYWHPELFNLDSSAGAPPDFFSADGQNWGFPTYNWDEMAKDDYAWWKSRLRKMARYFDAFRIDHILGFFRIWEIPLTQKSGMFGHFNPALPYTKEEIAAAGLPLDPLFHEDPRNPGLYQPLISPKAGHLPLWQQERFGAFYNDFFFHRHNEFWRINAERKLPELLGATGMLACGEDLGMVPDCVPGVMERERILTLEMKQMDKNRPWPALSVCASSSHDMETLRMQMDHDPEPWECEKMLREYLDSCCMLAIFPIQDWLALDGNLRRADRMRERINDPANPAHKWRFRLHLTVEELLASKGLNATIFEMIKSSGRQFD